MNPQLLHYYERELAWLRQASAGFAAAHPRIAGNLNLREGVIEDPHVSRLVESVALLNARVQQRLDDDFPLISDALTEQLHPQLLAPVPAMTVVEMLANDCSMPLTIAAHTMLCTTPVDGISCQFRTVYPVTLLPLRLQHARLQSSPLQTPGAAPNAASALFLQLQADSDDFSFAASDTDVLRLFLRPAPHAWKLHALLTDHCIGIVLNSETNGSWATVGGHGMRVMGFAEDECLLPSVRPAATAFSHLSEFLHFPQKHLFFELRGLAAASTNLRGDVSLILYFDTADNELERHVDASAFSLTATPVVNLFRHAAEPITLTAGSVEYPLLADVRHRDGYEVYDIEAMTMIDELTGERHAILPFYGCAHNADETGGGYWHHRREFSVRSRDGGLDSFVTFSDTGCIATCHEHAVIHADLICSNRNLPVRPGAAEPGFRLRQDGGRLRQIRPLLPFTAPVRRARRNGARWRLLSYVNGNLRGLLSGGDAATALREILTLHIADDTAATRALIAAIDDVQITGIMLPLRSNGHPVLCRGTDICITFDDSKLAGFSLSLYAMALEHFLAQSVAMNSFIRVRARCKGSTDIVRYGPPRAGTQSLL